MCHIPILAELFELTILFFCILKAGSLFRKPGLLEWSGFNWLKCQSVMCSTYHSIFKTWLSVTCQDALGRQSFNLEQRNWNPIKTVEEPFRTVLCVGCQEYRSFRLMKTSLGNMSVRTTADATLSRLYLRGKHWHQLSRIITLSQKVCNHVQIILAARGSVFFMHKSLQMQFQLGHQDVRNPLVRRPRTLCSKSGEVDGE